MTELNRLLKDTMKTDILKNINQNEIDELKENMSRCLSD